jgi:hypothetical protein
MNKYLAQCSWRSCRHLTASELKSKYHCTNSKCRNWLGKCEQHSPDGEKLLNARLDRG